MLETRANATEAANGIRHIARFEKEEIDQRLELERIAERRGWQVTEVYEDFGISGAKGRDKRPALDRMLKDANRRRFDLVMAWSIDRVGSSLTDLLGTIQHLEAVGVDLYLDQQNIDTTTPMGKLIFPLQNSSAAWSGSGHDSDYRPHGNEAESAEDSRN